MGETPMSAEKPVAIGGVEYATDEPVDVVAEWRRLKARERKLVAAIQTFMFDHPEHGQEGSRLRMAIEEDADGN